MKQLFTIAILAFGLQVGFAQTKSTNEDFQIPNGGLENWYTVTVNPSVTYEELGTGPTDNWLGTLNSLAAVPPIAGGPGPVTVFKTTDAHSGSFAAKAVSANFPLGPVNVFIPGMLGTAVMNNATVSAILGKPCVDCRPSKLKGYYKFEPVNGDSCAALVVVTKWNTGAGKRDTIGMGYLLEKNAVSSYTAFEVPVTYLSSGPADSITVLMVASAGMNLVNFMACAGQEGSAMYVDDLSLDYPSGVQQVLLPEVGVTLYPNPASGPMHLELTREVKNAVVEIYTAGMKLAGTFTFSGREHTIDMTGMPAGSYYFRLVSGRDLLNTGSFVVSR